MLKFASVLFMIVLMLTVETVFADSKVPTPTLKATKVEVTHSAYLRTSLDKLAFVGLNKDKWIKVNDGQDEVIIVKVTDKNGAPLSHDGTGFLYRPKSGNKNCILSVYRWFVEPERLKEFHNMFPLTVITPAGDKFRITLK